MLPVFGTNTTAFTAQATLYSVMFNRADMSYWMKNVRDRLKPYLNRRTRAIAGSILAVFLGFFLFQGITEILIDEIAIFGFHDIVDLSNEKEVPPKRPKLDGDYIKQDLEQFLTYLLEHNYWFLSAQDLYDYFVKPNPDPIPPEHQKQKKVAIAIDDGYENAHHNLLALSESLEKQYGKKITIIWFINPPFMGVPGKELDHASCDELKEGVKQGYYDLQSHGSNHTDFTTLSPQKLKDDVSNAQIILRKCVGNLDKNGTVGKHIAYPNGGVNPQVVEIVAKYYESGYLYNNSTFKVGRIKDVYHIPRISIHNRLKVNRLIRLAEGGWL
jgi:poly-beta-1,6-N-acetyl-D-glucosamine N-deacetylase